MSMSSPACTCRSRSTTCVSWALATWPSTSMAKPRTSESGWWVNSSNATVTSLSPRMPSCFRACAAEMRTLLSASPSTPTAAANASGLPSSAVCASASSAAQRSGAPRAGPLLRCDAREVSVAMACGSPLCHRRRSVASATAATSSTRSHKAPAATSMPRRPPVSSTVAINSTATARTSGSGCPETSRPSCMMSSEHSPRCGQIVLIVLAAVLRTEQSGSDSARTATSRLQPSPRTASACNASAACTRRSGLAVPS
mmetsp:Transcript_27605/g.75910  ORF Transcript_27605/g.75910 Transcript_27605/m.75910 type:complete len:256 (-) Transcript_27605:816-1583(-)